MQIDADSFKMVLEGAVGAFVILVGRDAIGKFFGRNGRSKESKPPTFTEQAESMPGHSTFCEHERKARGKIEARLAVLEGTKHD